MHTMPTTLPQIINKEFLQQTFLMHSTPNLASSGVWPTSRWSAIPLTLRLWSLGTPTIIVGYGCQSWAKAWSMLSGRTTIVASKMLGYCLPILLKHQERKTADFLIQFILVSCNISPMPLWETKCCWIQLQATWTSGIMLCYSLISSMPTLLVPTQSSWPMELLIWPWKLAQHHIRNSFSALCLMVLVKYSPTMVRPIWFLFFQWMTLTKELSLCLPTNPNVLILHLSQA